MHTKDLSRKWEREVSAGVNFYNFVLLCTKGLGMVVLGLVRAFVL